MHSQPTRSRVLTSCAPDGDYGDDAYDMGDGQGAALGIAMELSSELREIGESPRPGHGDGKRRHA